MFQQTVMFSYISYFGALASLQSMYLAFGA